MKNEIFLYEVNYDYSNTEARHLDMYYGYFLVDGEKLDGRLLSIERKRELMNDGESYFVPLMVKQVTVFSEDNLIVFRDGENDYMYLCDGEDFLEHVNKTPEKHLLIVVDGEDSSTLDKILNV